MFFKREKKKYLYLGGTEMGAVNTEKNNLRISISEMKSFSKERKKIYIYGNGSAGRWLWDKLESLGISIEAFIDTDIKKIRENFGFPTMSIADSEKVISSDDLIIIGAVDIHEILIIKNQTALKNIPWMSLGKFVKDSLDAQVLPQPTEFEKYAVEVVMECHTRLLDPNDLFLRSVDIMITEKCSLKCQDCANLMQYYVKPQDGTLDGIISSVDWLSSVVDGVYEFRLIGGEPFMNKRIYEIIEQLLAFDIFNKLVIYTNGMIPLKDKYRDLLLDERVVFSVTDYGDLAKNTGKFVQQLQDWGCVHRVHPPEHWTDSGRIKKQNRTDIENQSLFDECCGKNLWTLSDQGFGRCPFAINAAHLGAVSFEDNSVVSVSDKAGLREYVLNGTFLPACDLCNGRSFSADEITPAVQTRIPLIMEI
jgi:organic radical activating enzyme